MTVDESIATTGATLIVAATKNSAEILRIEGETGTVTAGKSADFVVLKRNPLDDITCVAEPEMFAIVKEGTFVKNEIV